ncbi:hypothetical protein BT69DRAFT_1324641 [Atractiella rhizophila]|nr:hypothetical protein BT69DRAFT_1324641 [Atractiella rhizophila]
MSIMTDKQTPVQHHVINIVEGGAEQKAPLGRSLANRRWIAVYLAKYVLRVWESRSSRPESAIMAASVLSLFFLSQDIPATKSPIINSFPSAAPLRPPPTVELNRSTEVEARVPAPELIPVISMIVVLLLGYTHQEDPSIFQRYFSAFLVLLSAIAWMDIRCRMRARNPRSREAARNLVPWFAFWTFHLIITSGFTPSRRWILAFLPAIVGGWAIGVLVVCSKHIKGLIHKIVTTKRPDHEGKNHQTV